MALSQADMRALIGDQLWPALQAERDRLNRIDKWYRWSHDDPHRPRHSTAEYKELAARAQTPWLHLVVTAVAQALYVEGYRRAKEPDNAASWGIWQANGMDSRQISVHRAALAYGAAYVTVLPGISPSGDDMPAIRGVDPSAMVAFYLDPAEDEWPAFALRADPTADGHALRAYDDEYLWRFLISQTGELTYVEFEEHGAGVCPIVRFANQLDLRGRTPGEVEPFIPVAGRIDQTTFDRLVVQRFSSWVVRTVSGMARPDSEEEANAARLRLKVEDLLVAEDPDTRFGSLPATPLDGFIAAKDADIRDLAAVSQTPPHHLLGQIANLSAEALAAAEASLNRKVQERKHSFGESWEQTLRLAARLAGDDEGASDMEAQVRWRDMESRSLAQSADALGKLATMLNVPTEVLWEQIPGWTQQDVERAKALSVRDGGMAQLLERLTAGRTTPPTA